MSSSGGSRTRPATAWSYEVPDPQGARRLWFETAPGVFSADGPDPGTILLLETLLPRIKSHERVLDIGTGCGLLGLAIATRLDQGEVWMVDVDIRAVRVAGKNVERNRLPNAHVLLGDGTADLPPKSRFHLIASNPPTHDGRQVLEQLVEQSYATLRPGGSLWIVVNRLLSMKDLMQRTFGNVAVEAKSGGYLVLRSERSRGE